MKTVTEIWEAAAQIVESVPPDEMKAYAVASVAAHGTAIQQLERLRGILEHTAADLARQTARAQAAEDRLRFLHPEVSA